MGSSIRRILAGLGGSVIALAASGGHAAYITGQQYTFSASASNSLDSYFVSGSFTIGAEILPGTFNFASFSADSGAPGTDVLSGIDATDTVTSGGLFNVTFTLADGYGLPFATPTGNLPDTVSLFGADNMRYFAAGTDVQQQCQFNLIDGSTTCEVTTTPLAVISAGTFSVQLTDGGNRVPEPGVLALAGFAASAGALAGRRRRRG